MQKLSISRAWDETKAVVRRDGRLIASVALALLVLPEVLSQLIAPPVALSGQRPPQWFGIVALIVGLIGILGQIAIARLALGPSTSVGEGLARAAQRLLPTFLALLLFGVALTVVLVPLMVLIAGVDSIASVATENPASGAITAVVVAVLIGMLIAPRFQMVVPAAAAEDGGPVYLLRRSWHVTSGSYWKLLGFLLLALLLAITLVIFLGQLLAGVLVKGVFGTIDPFSLGALIAGLLTGIASAVFGSVLSIMLARIYVQLSGRGDVQPSVPISGT